MVDTSNTEFIKVYDKLMRVIDTKIKTLFDYRQIGKSVDYNTVKILNIYSKYLNSIIVSKYTYIDIGGLNGIYNFLNKL